MAMNDRRAAPRISCCRMAVLKMDEELTIDQQCMISVLMTDLG